MAEILALPKGMRTIPVDAKGFTDWVDKAMAYRCKVRDDCEADEGARADALAMAADDPAYDFLVFGAVFEPRDRPNRPKGWYPWIPYEFQVRLLRWIQDVYAVIPGTEAAKLGRGDGVLEKGRDMAGSWTFCGFMAHQWKYDDGFAGGLMSYNQDAVEKGNSTGTLFHKVEGYLGLDVRVPEYRPLIVDGAEVQVPIRSPLWMIPEGYDANRHNIELSLGHPTKTNVITGYTTTQRVGIGVRLSMLVMDEAAKFAEFRTAWDNTSASTDHRFALSSPDVRFGVQFRDLARFADRAVQKGEKAPSFIRLRPDEHPFKDDIWREEIEARHTGSDEALDSLAREYDLDYDAGSGNKIYPSSLTIEPKKLTFNPSRESLDFCLDPGTRDMAAFHLIKYDPGYHKYGLLLSYANNGKPAEFYATLVTASPMYGTYEYGEEEERVMEFFESYGRHIRFWIGDPAGKAKTGSHLKGKLTSWYDDFRTATQVLTDGRRSIIIKSSDKHVFKRLDGRMRALRWLLPLLEVNDTPDTRRTLAAIQDHHWPAKTSQKETTFLNLEPVRTPGFDRVTALEYYAVDRQQGGIVEDNGIAAPVRLTASGKQWSDRKKRGYGG